MAGTETVGVLEEVGVEKFVADLFERYAHPEERARCVVLAVEACKKCGVRTVIGVVVHHALHRPGRHQLAVEFVAEICDASSP